MHQVGLDISTFEGIQSLFGDRVDPWGLECLVNWIDICAEHDDVRFALPKPLPELREEIVFPEILQRAQEAELIAPVSDDSAAVSIPLSNEELERLYVVFDAWASANYPSLVQWLNFSRSVRRINAGRLIDEGPLNRWVRDQFWSTRREGLFEHANSEGAVDGDGLQLAFDMVVRAAQYHVAFGTERAYQAHPMRALYAPSNQSALAVPPWGWLLAMHIAQGDTEWDVSRVVSEVLHLRHLIRENHATTDELVNDPQDVRQQKLNGIAVGAGMDILPSGFTNWMHRIAITIGVPLEAIGHVYHVPFVGVAWELLQIPVLRRAEATIQRLSYIQRRVAFPGEHSPRPTMELVRRRFTRSVEP